MVIREWTILIPGYSVVLISLTYFMYWALAIYDTPSFSDLRTITGQFESNLRFYSRLKCQKTRKDICPRLDHTIRTSTTPIRKRPRKCMTFLSAFSIVLRIMVSVSQNGKYRVIWVRHLIDSTRTRPSASVELGKFL
jgi:hypothetical protein